MSSAKSWCQAAVTVHGILLMLDQWHFSWSQAMRGLTILNKKASLHLTYSPTPVEDGKMKQRQEQDLERLTTPNRSFYHVVRFLKTGYSDYCLLGLCSGEMLAPND